MSERVVTIRQRTNPDGRTGWEAMNLEGPIPETLTIGLRETAEEVVRLVAKMQDAGMISTDAIVKVVR